MVQKVEPGQTQDLQPRGAKFEVPGSGFYELRAVLSTQRIAVLGIVGAVGFFCVWEIGHQLMSESGKRFLPSVVDVMSRLFYLFTEKNFVSDVLISCYRVFVSFFFASITAIPLGIMMGCFAGTRALLNPVLSGARYLPAASFIPVLLVWFGPSDLAKMALLYIGVVFFLIVLILDNTEAVQKELVEAALTMGASRWRVVLGVVVPAAAPSILDSMRTMIAVSWTYLVIAEIVGAQNGIGAVMMRAGRFLHVDTIMAGILMIGILGVLTDLAFRGVAALAFPWARGRTG